MATFFISDLHLQTEKPIIYANFLHFLRYEATAADALYILGDLFESWVGDDDHNQLHHEAALAIKTLVNSGVPCFFIHGNRDFLMGKRFACKSGMIFLPEEKVLNLYGHKILIMHGDTLCTSDINYQIFRSGVNIPLVRMLFLALPLFIRNNIVAKIRANSVVAQSNKLRSITNVNSQAVLKVMEKYCVQWLIHGHTHHPMVHKFMVNRKPAFRITLGMWQDTNSMVKVTSQKIELVHFHF